MNMTKKSTIDTQGKNNKYTFIEYQRPSSTGVKYRNQRNDSTRDDDEDQI